MEITAVDQGAEDSIATRSSKVLQQFSKVAAKLEADEDALSDVQEWTSLNDSLQRYQLWAGSQGALHQSADPRSLDHKLRYTPLIAKAIIELLQELDDLLEHPSSNEGESLSTQSASSPVAAFEDDELAAELIDEIQGPDDEGPWILDSIEDLLGRLFKVSMLAQQSHARDRYARAEASTGPKFNEYFDIMHVTEYVKARNGAAQQCPWLLERLGKAITRRRNFILYCREHKERIAASDRQSTTRNFRANEPEQVSGSAQSDGASLPPRTRTGVSRPSAAQTSATTLIPATGVEAEELDEREASTIASSVDFRQGPNALRPPDLTEFATLGLPFECPYCSKLQQFGNTKAWRRHVRSDIRPFLCTFSECGLLMFEDRQSWEDHELQKHRRSWNCQFCSDKPFRSSSSLRDHFRHQHQIEVEGDQSSAMFDAFSRPEEQLPASDCLICDWAPELKRLNEALKDVDTVTVTRTHFMKHLAGHLEQFALFALPRIVKYDLGSNDAGGGDDGEMSSRDVVSSFGKFAGRILLISPKSDMSSISISSNEDVLYEERTPSVGGSKASVLQQIEDLPLERNGKETTSAWIKRCEAYVPKEMGGDNQENLDTSMPHDNDSSIVESEHSSEQVVSRVANTTAIEVSEDIGEHRSGEQSVEEHEYDMYKEMRMLERVCESAALTLSHHRSGGPYTWTITRTVGSLFILSSRLMDLELSFVGRKTLGQDDIAALGLQDVFLTVRSVLSDLYKTFRRMSSSSPTKKTTSVKEFAGDFVYLNGILSSCQSYLSQVATQIANPTQERDSKLRNIRSRVIDQRSFAYTALELEKSWESSESDLRKLKAWTPLSIWGGIKSAKSAADLVLVIATRHEQRVAQAQLSKEADASGQKSEDIAATYIPPTVSAWGSQESDEWQERDKSQHKHTRNSNTVNSQPSESRRGSVASTETNATLVSTTAVIGHEDGDRESQIEGPGIGRLVDDNQSLAGQDQDEAGQNDSVIEPIPQFEDASGESSGKPHGIINQQFREGSTSVPKHLVSLEAIRDLDCAYVEHGDCYLLSVGLEKEQIDEMIRNSQSYRSGDKRSGLEDEEKFDEALMIPLPPSPEPQDEPPDDSN